MFTRFRMLVIASFAALALATAGAASAATIGGQPTPTPPPTPTPTPVLHHHHHHPRTHCFTSVLSEFDSQHGQQLAAPKWQRPAKDEIVVVQLAEVCVTGHKVTATDISKPFAWETGTPLPAGVPAAAGNYLRS